MIELAGSYDDISPIVVQAIELMSNLVYLDTVAMGASTFARILDSVLGHPKIEDITFFRFDPAVLALRMEASPPRRPLRLDLDEFTADPDSYLAISTFLRALNASLVQLRVNLGDDPGLRDLLSFPPFPVTCLVCAESMRGSTGDELADLQDVFEHFSTMTELLYLPHPSDFGWAGSTSTLALAAEDPQPSSLSLHEATLLNLEYNGQGPERRLVSLEASFEKSSANVDLGEVLASLAKSHPMLETIDLKDLRFVSSVPSAFVAIAYLAPSSDIHLHPIGPPASPASLSHHASHRDPHCACSWTVARKRLLGLDAVSARIVGRRRGWCRAREPFPTLLRADPPSLTPGGAHESSDEPRRRSRSGPSPASIPHRHSRLLPPEPRVPPDLSSDIGPVEKDRA